MNNLEVEYQVHQEGTGWSEWVKNGTKAGVTGKSLRLEAIKFRLLNKGDEDISLQCNPHLENIGWAGFVTEDNTCGTTGEARRLEGLQLNLVGKNADKYSIQYRVHSRNIGTMDFAKDGELAGSEGGGLWIESIQLLITYKGVNLALYEVPSFIHYDPKPVVVPVVAGKLGLKYFNEDTEFLCECGCGLDVKDQMKIMMDQAREIYGHPITISSGARCPTFNAKVGGVTYSNHIARIAVDSYGPTRMNYNEVDVLAGILQSVGFRTISYHENLFVHADLDSGSSWSMN